MVFNWLNIAIILGLAVGVLFAAGPLFGSILLAPKSKGGDLNAPYECGLLPHGTPRVKFGINYFFYALLFLAFDVDVLYLFPVAAEFPHSQGFLPLLKVFIFLAVLGLGCIYFWKKGVFTWPRKIS